MRRIDQKSAIPLSLAITVLCLFLVAQGFALQDQASGLKIVVLEGENGVNIIKQNTAVKPVVEVRDKNNLPVAGALVLFLLLPRGKAGGTFGNGLKEYSILTDANGRAAIEGLHPTGPGAFKLEVRASYEGQTAMTTINQTNFTTSADAVRAGKEPGDFARHAENSDSGNSGSASNSAASSSGGASSAGGGMSALATAGVVGGLGAAGAAAAYKYHEQSAAKNCDAHWNLVLADLNSEAQICSSSTATRSQCQSAAQRGLNDLGQACSCMGGAAKVPAEYQDMLQQLRSLARSLGLTVPASCGF